MFPIYIYIYPLKNQHAGILTDCIRVFEGKLSEYNIGIDMWICVNYYNHLNGDIWLLS